MFIDAIEVHRSISFLHWNLQTQKIQNHQQKLKIQKKEEKYQHGCVSALTTYCMVCRKS